MAFQFLGIDTNRLCSTCSDISRVLSQSEVRNEKLRFRTDLGPPEDVKQRAPTCSFCQHVYKTFRLEFPLYVPNGEGLIKVFISRKRSRLPQVAEGITSSLGSGRSYATVLSASVKVDSLCQKPFFEFSTRGDGILSMRRVGSGSLQTFNIPRTTISRGPDENVPVNYDLLNRWRLECESQHKHTCDHADIFNFLRYPENLFCVDVDNNRITRVSPFTKYVALSYVWGRKKTVKHTRRNNWFLRTNGSLVHSQLPRTIRDAMDVTRGMGYQFLWVDSLCIIQNHSSHKKHQMREMSSIYAHAVFTIVGASGKDSHAGLSRLRMKKVDQLCQKAKTSLNIQLRINREEEDIFSPRGRVGSSEWWRRGWTLQEFLFSSRLLIFTEDQIYWHCNGADWQENSEMINNNCRFLEFSSLNHSRWASSGRFLRSFFRLRSTDMFAPESRCYLHLVKEYKRRKLTHLSDILDAFAGIIIAKERRCRYSFHWGLQEQKFSESLSWIYNGARQTKLKGWMSYSKKSGPMDRFPSYCWAAWAGEPDQFDWVIDTSECIQSVVKFYRWDPHGGWEVVDEHQIKPSELGSTMEATWKGNDEDFPIESNTVKYHSSLLRFWASRTKVMIKRKVNSTTDELEYNIVGWSEESQGPQEPVDLYFGSTDEVQFASAGSFAMENAEPDGDQTFEAHIIVYGRIFRSEQFSSPMEWNPTDRLVALITEKRNGIDYRLGLAVLSESKWMSIPNRDWELCLLG